MQPVEKLSSDKKRAIRKLRDDYLKKVNIKIVSPSGHEQYVHQGSNCRPKVKANIRKSTLIHEPCFMPSESSGERRFQSQKSPRNDVDIQTFYSVTGNKSHLPDSDGSTDGKGRIPLELRRQNKLDHRLPPGAPVQFSSETDVSMKSSQRKYAPLSVKTPPQFEPLRDCIQELWERNQRYIVLDKLCGASEIHEQIPLREAVDKISKSEFRRRPPTFPASTATTSMSPQGIYFSPVEDQFHESSSPFSRSPERHNRRQAADSPTRHHEQHDDSDDYTAKEKRTEVDAAPAETPPRMKPMLACVYQKGDVFVIHPLSAMKDST
ncbi:hypothetical protein BsWGS_08001 [Bradybaena similaris]